MVDEIAPFAHDVYVLVRGEDALWWATFRTKQLADQYANWLRTELAKKAPGVVVEVRELD